MTRRLGRATLRSDRQYRPRYGRFCTPCRLRLSRPAKTQHNPEEMDWDDVRVFAAVARQRSLSVGARAAAVDRSTAGRRIAALERALGARLFLRTRDGLRLSAAGERLLAH